ncbi:hypothetical protein J6590_010079 [Homalodisca vitripennis]|nr:hypothetical protein J6590_010079 [Homalodisca vitripennis]
MDVLGTARTERLYEVHRRAALLPENRTGIAAVYITACGPLLEEPLDSWKSPTQWPSTIHGYEKGALSENDSNTYWVVTKKVLDQSRKRWRTDGRYTDGFFEVKL